MINIYNMYVKIIYIINIIYTYIIYKYMYFIYMYIYDIIMIMPVFCILVPKSPVVSKLIEDSSPNEFFSY